MISFRKKIIYLLHIANADSGQQSANLGQYVDAEKAYRDYIEKKNA
jgi:hypothetical protein